MFGASRSKSFAGVSFLGIVGVNRDLTVIRVTVADDDVLGVAVSGVFKSTKDTLLFFVVEPPVGPESACSL